MTSAHEVDTVYMFYDTLDECSYLGQKDMTTLSYPYDKYNYDQSLSDLASVEKSKIKFDLYNFLCDGYGVATNSALISETNYYGYMAANTPVPCAEALVSQVWAYLQTLP